MFQQLDDHHCFRGEDTGSSKITASYRASPFYLFGMVRQFP